MLEELSARLTKILEQKRLKKKLEQDLLRVEEEFQDKSTRLESLSTQLEEEKVDVEKFERISLTALFYSVLGSREQQLEKERQELLSAQLLYQQTKHQVDFLLQDREYLLQQLNNLKDVDSEYESLLSEKEQLLRQSNKPVASELVGYSETIANLNSEVKEISEAIIAGNDVISGLEQVIESLGSAEGWGTWDMLGGGLISTAIKHSRIDDARMGVNDVQTKMSQFKRELADVRKNAELQIEIGELETFADFFFDNLIVDWVVQSKIVDSLEQSKQAKNVIGQAVDELENQKKNAQEKINDLQEKRAQLIERT
jgi:chromosome segregation ATPase